MGVNITQFKHRLPCLTSYRHEVEQAEPLPSFLIDKLTPLNQHVQGYLCYVVSLDKIGVLAGFCEI